jgi:3-deoxy-D-manno-octulosonic-acid transferase
MASLYEAADIIILGGSFVDKGGHNPLEIALFETPILAGPSRFKNKDAFESLSKAGLIELASDENKLASLLADKLEALRKGRALITAKNKKQIAAITTEACSRAAKTADYLLDKHP